MRRGDPSPPVQGPGSPRPPEPRPPPEDGGLAEARVRDQLRAMSRRGFATGGVIALGALLGWRWLLRWATMDEGLAWPLRRVLRANEAISRVLFSPARLAPTFPWAAAEHLRANGMYGLQDEAFRPEHWRLVVTGAGAEPASLSLASLQALPRTEMITEFKCIEGWSTVAQWAGVRFADLARACPPATRSGQPFDPDRAGDAPPYVSLATPDGRYYVGFDSASALHPQTLLAWELNGAPLTMEHGAPLRLVTPVKYGIKNIKRLGTITWTTERPADYWAEKGYDWFAGL